MFSADMSFFLFICGILTKEKQMSDNRGKGEQTDEGRVEKNPSRPYENNPGKDDKPDKGQDTNERVRDILNKK